MFWFFKAYLLQDTIVFLYSDKLPYMPPYVHQPYHCSQILSYIKSLGLNIYSDSDISNDQNCYKYLQNKPTQSQLTMHYQCEFSAIQQVINYKPKNTFCTGLLSFIWSIITIIFRITNLNFLKSSRIISILKGKI